MTDDLQGDLFDTEPSVKHARIKADAEVKKEAIKGAVTFGIVAATIGATLIAALAEQKQRKRK